MSVMHIAGGIIIGLLVGRIFSLFSLRIVKGGKYTFMLGGVFGSLAADLTFYMLYNYEYVSSFFYKQAVIVFEMFFGALLVCYLINKFGSKRDIDLE